MTFIPWSWCVIHSRYLGYLTAVSAALKLMPSIRYGKLKLKLKLKSEYIDFCLFFPVVLAFLKGGLVYKVSMLF